MNKAITALSQKEFLTQRLEIKGLNPKDATFMQALTNSAGWLKFIGDRNIHSPEQAREYMEKIDQNPDAKYWKVCLKENQIPIGVITLIQRDYLDDIDIGFAFLPQYSKKGYAFEASKKILDQVIPLTDTGCIYGTTIKDNISSIGLLEKLGLAKTATLSRDGEDLELYVISR